MKTKVIFRSSKFPPYDGELKQPMGAEYWGKRLAEHIVPRLNERGFQTMTLVPEDWGWYIPIENSRFPLRICCGHETGDQFMCYIDPSTPTVQIKSRKIDTTQEIGQVINALDDILKSDPDIRDPKWVTGEGD